MKLLLEDKVIKSWAKVGSFMPNENQYVIEVSDIPIEVQNDISEKWCYTAEQGYFLNKNYVEIEPPISYENEIKELKQQIQSLSDYNAFLEDAICELDEVINGGNE